MREVGEEERKRMLKTLESQYKMSVASLKDTYRELKKKVDANGRRVYTDEEMENTDSVILIKRGMDDMKEQYAFMGGNPDNLDNIASGSKMKKSIKNAVNKNILDIASSIATEDKKPVVNKIVEEKKTITNITEVNGSKTYIPDETPDENPMSSFDVIPLPSKGECYKDRFATIPVGFLTAYDENIIINPNLYGQNLVIDTLLKRKVLDKSIDVDDLLEGDRDAIILFLRRTGYGNDYPITAKDNETGIEFSTTIDLSKLKYKDFDLKSDKSGWFDFVLPITKKTIKFRFLTHRDRIILDKIEDIENESVKKARMTKMKDELEFIADNDEKLANDKKISLRNAVRTIEDVVDSLEDTDERIFTQRMSNELEYSIMSIDGNDDREYIHDFVNNMPIMDATELRLYISKNTPGIKYEFEIEKPQSLGGGSMKVFPQFNQFIFLNRAK